MNVKGVIFDWAGTVVDHGSRAPVATLEAIFGSAGVPITVAEARASMGIAKKEHIHAILRMDRVREAWKGVHGVNPGEAELDKLYAEFIPRQFDCLLKHSDVIQGVPETVERLRARGLKIGSSTGYTRPMLEMLSAAAEKQGFRPDAAFCPSDVPAGRPAPWMCFANAMRMGVYPMSAMVKIGDTPSDMEEGRNAGMWTIGITRTGNETGLTQAEWDQLPDHDREPVLRHAASRLIHAGAHYIAATVAEADALIDRIDDAITAGLRP